MYRGDMNALGMVETKGLVAAIEAADAMIKAAMLLSASSLQCLSISLNL
jgi:hypothetical protein